MRTVLRRKGVSAELAGLSVTSTLAWAWPESPSAPEAGDTLTESAGSGSSSSMVACASEGEPAVTPAGR